MNLHSRISLCFCKTEMWKEVIKITLASSSINLTHSQQLRKNKTFHSAREVTSCHSFSMRITPPGLCHCGSPLWPCSGGEGGCDKILPHIGLLTFPFSCLLDTSTDSCLASQPLARVKLCPAHLTSFVTSLFPHISPRYPEPEPHFWRPAALSVSAGVFLWLLFFHNLIYFYVICISVSPA